MNNDLFMAAASLEDGSSKNGGNTGNETLGGAEVAHHFRSIQNIDHKLAAG